MSNSPRLVGVGGRGGDGERNLMFGVSSTSANWRKYNIENDLCALQEGIGPQLFLVL